MIQRLYNNKQPSTKNKSNKQAVDESGNIKHDKYMFNDIRLI